MGKCTCTCVGASVSFMTSACEQANGELRRMKEDCGGPCVAALVAALARVSVVWSNEGKGTECVRGRGWEREGRGGATEWAPHKRGTPRKRQQKGWGYSKQSWDGVLEACFQRSAHVGGREGALRVCNNGKRRREGGGWPVKGSEYHTNPWAQA